MTHEGRGGRRKLVCLRNEVGGSWVEDGLLLQVARKLIVVCRTVDGTRTESEDRPATTSAGARVSSSFAPSRAGVVQVWRDVGSTATLSLSVALERGGETWGVGYDG